MPKVILQHDIRDCGAACLAMITDYFGTAQSLARCRELTKTDRNGANLYGLVDGAAQLGLQAEALSGSPQELTEGIKNHEITFPFIAHIVTEDGLQHYVVVFRYKKGRFFLGDPGRGKLWCREAVFFARWDGYIVTFAKTEKFQTQRKKVGGLLPFFELLRGQEKLLAVVLILSLLIAVIGILGSMVFQLIINDIMTPSEAGGATAVTKATVLPMGANILDSAASFMVEHSAGVESILAAMIGLYLLQAVIQLSRGWLMALLSRRIDTNLILSYFGHMMELPLASASTRDTGEYLSRFSDASTIRNAISGATLTLVLDSVMVLGCGIILFLTQPLLFFISMGMVLIYAVVVVCYRRPLEQANRRVMEDNARVQSYLKQAVDGLETVKAHRAEAWAKQINAEKFRRLLSSIFKNSLLSVSQDSLCDFIELAGTVLILWAGYRLISVQMLSLASLITFYALLAYFTAPIKNLIELQPMIQTATVAAERLNDILEMESEESQQSDKAAGKSVLWDKIEFSHVNFRYGNHELTLKDISLSIHKGQRVAFVGESGSGKTTLAKLLLRFYQPESGMIKIDACPLHDFTLDQLRRNVAYVDQNTFLFSDTVRNNLCLGNPEATEEELLDVCRMVRADSFIEKLPQKYDTFLEENGCNLSGGQRQRLAIARALLRHPKVLILDEATSNLDTITENAIRETIFSLSREMTCILIAHRLSTIQACDRIYVMENGRIAEKGTHEELLEKDGLYRRYFTL